MLSEAVYNEYNAPSKMPNWIRLLPTIGAFISFILSLLCLFSGTRMNFLTGNDIFKVCLDWSTRSVYEPTNGSALYTHRQWHRSSRLLCDLSHVLLWRIFRGRDEHVRLLGLRYPLHIQRDASITRRFGKQRIIGRTRMADSHQR